MSSIESHRRSRGAAFIYAVVLMGASALLIGASLELAASARRGAVRSEEAIRARLALEGAKERTAALSTSVGFAASGNETRSWGGQSYSVRRSPATEALELSLAVTCPDGTVLQGNAPRPAMASYANYALFVETSADLGDSLQVGNAVTPAHTYFNQRPKLNSSSTYRFLGAVDTAASASDFAGFNPDRAGPVTYGVAGGTLPARSPTLMLAASNQSTGSSTVTGFDFNSLGGTLGRAPLLYCSGDVQLGGVWRGQGTVYVKGKTEIQLPLTMADADSKLVVISDDDVAIKGTGALQCFVFGNRKIEQKEKNGTVSIIGALWSESVKTNTAVTMAYDRFFWNGTGSLNRFYLPLVAQ